MRPPWTLRTDVSQAPFFVCWETTKACLLACRHCRAKAIKRSLPGELSRLQGFTLVDQLVEFGEPYPALLLTGGDPLMREDFFELVEYAKERGIYVAVAASVTPRLTRETISKMKALGVDIMSVSLDGAAAETHDRLRGVPGTWEATVRAVHEANESGLRAQVNTTVMRSNVEELADIFHVVRGAGSVAWEVFFLIRTGRGASLESLLPEECEEVMHFLYDASQYDVPIRTAEGPSFRRVRAQRQVAGMKPRGALYQRLSQRLGELEGGASAGPVFKVTHSGDGKGIMFVGHDGVVYPSGFLPLRAGKFPEDSLVTIYRSSTLFASLRDPSKLRGRCGVCEYGAVCGGSRSRAFAELGDAFGEDPACPYVPVAGAHAST